jgi:hypothetical protein
LCVSKRPRVASPNEKPHFICEIDVIEDHHLIDPLPYYFRFLIVSSLVLSHHQTPSVGIHHSLSTTSWTKPF